MSGSFLTGPPREADEGGQKGGIEGDFPLCDRGRVPPGGATMKGSFLAGKPRPLGWEFQLALFIRSDRRERGNLNLSEDIRDCFSRFVPSQ